MKGRTATWEESDGLLMAYIYKDGKTAPGGSVKQRPVECQAVIDYGADGDILGVEFIVGLPETA